MKRVNTDVTSKRKDDIGNTRNVEITNGEDFRGRGEYFSVIRAGAYRKMVSGREVQLIAVTGQGHTAEEAADDAMAQWNAKTGRMR